MGPKMSLNLWQHAAVKITKTDLRNRPLNSALKSQISKLQFSAFLRALCACPERRFRRRMVSALNWPLIQPNPSKSDQIRLTFFLNQEPNSGNPLATHSNS